LLKSLAMMRSKYFFIAWAAEPPSSNTIETGGGESECYRGTDCRVYATPVPPILSSLWLV
jgi:hypothetical protein